MLGYLGFCAASSEGLAQEREVVEHTPTLTTLPPPRTELRVGERLAFHGRWFGIPVGHGWIEVKALVPFRGQLAYAIEAQGHSNDFLSSFYPIHDVIRSYLDAKTLQPLQFEKYQREGHYQADEIVTFDYARMVATYRSLLNHSVKEIPLTEHVHDIVSAFYWLRTRPVNPSAAMNLDIYSDERIYHTQFQPHQFVTLELLWRGTFPCLLIEPLAKFRGVLVRRGRVWIYVTADACRLPLLVKIWTPWGLMTGLLDAESLRAQMECHASTHVLSGSSVGEARSSR